MYVPKEHDAIDLKMFCVTQAVNACPYGSDDAVVPLARDIYTFLTEGTELVDDQLEMGV